MPTGSLIEATGKVVSAHCRTSQMTTDQVITEIAKVHSALKNLDSAAPKHPTNPSRPHLNVKDAFRKDEVICMVCGKGGFKTLARHLENVHQMKAPAYRKGFGIPATQPLTSRSFSEFRREMAEARGLADNLAKAREVRQARVKAKKETETVGPPTPPQES